MPMPMQKKRHVAILTTFDGVQEAYSLNIVTQMQLKMLVIHGYKPVFIATKGFKAPENSWYAHKNVEIRGYSPVAKANNTEGYKDAEAFQNDAEAMAVELLVALKDIDVCITHDVIYQPDALKHKMACMIVAKKKPDLLWLHWVHSATAPALLKRVFEQDNKPIKEDYVEMLEKPIPNSMIIYPNTYDIPRVAQVFKVNEPVVKAVNHPMDITKYFDPLLEKLIFENDMLTADMVCTYPLRLDRGKQPEIVIKIMAALKKHNKSIRIIIADFHSTGGDKVVYREELRDLGTELGLEDKELIWLSDIWKAEAPQKVIYDLQSISNVFILPSKSETYSLVAQEAMRFGNVVMLNQDFPAIRSIYGDFALYNKFSSTIHSQLDVAEMNEGTTDTEYDNEWDYWDLCARRILSRYETSLSLNSRDFIRKTKNLQTIFRTQIEPLINSNLKG